MRVELEVRVQDVKWCRNVAPKGYPNKYTFCATFSVQKDHGDFCKDFITPEFIVDLPATSRLIVWKIAVEIKEDAPSSAKPSDLLRYDGFLKVVRSDGPSLASLKRQLGDWVKFSRTNLKQTVVKSWINRILSDFGLTEEAHKALPLEERRSLWASHDWTTYHYAVRFSTDGAWLTKKTLDELRGVCRLERPLVLPAYWEQRSVDSSPGLNRETPADLVCQNPWKPLGWSVCEPFERTSSFSFWSRYAALCGEPPFKQRESFQVISTKMHKIGTISFWKQWKAQWDLFFTEWVDTWGGFTSEGILQVANAHTLISLSGSCDAFLYEWISESPERLSQTTIFTTNPERAQSLSSLNMHVVVISLQGFFCEFGQPCSSTSSKPSQPLKPGAIRIQAVKPHYVFFDKAQNWTITHGHQAFKTIKERYDNPDVRIGVLYNKTDQTLIPWINDASPRLLTLLLEQTTGDINHHVCQHSESSNPAIDKRLAEWKDLKGVLVAETTQALQDKIYNFSVEKDSPLFVCERGTQMSLVRDTLYDTKSNTKIFKRERIYLYDLDMFGRVTTFQAQRRDSKPPRDNQASCGMFLRNCLDVCVRVGDRPIYFDLESLSAVKSSIIPTSLLEDFGDSVMFVLDDSWWIRMHHFKTFLKKLDPKRVYLIGTSRRLATLLS